MKIILICVPIYIYNLIKFVFKKFFYLQINYVESTKSSRLNKIRRCTTFNNFIWEFHANFS